MSIKSKGRSKSEGGELRGVNGAYHDVDIQVVGFPPANGYDQDRSSGLFQGLEYGGLVSDTRYFMVSNCWWLA